MTKRPTTTTQRTGDMTTTAKALLANYLRAAIAARAATAAADAARAAAEDYLNRC